MLERFKINFVLAGYFHSFGPWYLKECFLYFAVETFRFDCDYNFDYDYEFDC